jgi:hypothetical protein
MKEGDDKYHVNSLVVLHHGIHKFQKILKSKYGVEISKERAADKSLLGTASASWWEDRLVGSHK